jgi:hypothetical protein
MNNHELIDTVITHLSVLGQAITVQAVKDVIESHEGSERLAEVTDQEIEEALAFLHEKDEHMTGTTQNGDEVVLYVEQVVKACYVSIDSQELGYIQFNFNPDFPQDAKTFFDALLNVQSIEGDTEEPYDDDSLEADNDPYGHQEQQDFAHDGDPYNPPDYPDDYGE